MAVRGKIGAMRNRQHPAVHSGARPESRNKVQSFGLGRACIIASCTVGLSRYNATERCWTHRERRAPRLRGATLEERKAQLPVCEICDSHKQNELVNKPEDVEFNGVIHIRGFNGLGLSCEELALAGEFNREARIY